MEGPKERSYLSELQCTQGRGGRCVGHCRLSCGRCHPSTFRHKTQAAGYATTRVRLWLSYLGWAMPYYLLFAQQSRRRAQAVGPRRSALTSQLVPRPPCDHEAVGDRSFMKQQLACDATDLGGRLDDGESTCASVRGCVGGCVGAWVRGCVGPWVRGSVGAWVRAFVPCVRACTMRMRACVYMRMRACARACMYMCMRVCVRVHVHAYAYACVYKRICVCAPVYMRMRACACTCVCVCVRVHAYMRICVHAYAPGWRDRSSPPTRLCTCICVHAYAPGWRDRSSPPTRLVGVSEASLRSRVAIPSWAVGRAYL